MQSTANYIKPESKIYTPKKVNLRSLISIICVTFFFVISIAGFASSSLSLSTPTNKTAVVHADDDDDNDKSSFDPVRWVMCYFGKNSLPERAYQYANTDRLNFSLFSKSSITGGIDDVTSGYNWFVDLDKPNFKTKNEAVLGRILYELTDSDMSIKQVNNSSGSSAGTPTPTTQDSTTKKPKFNSGPQLNPFDRFGFAGLQFTAYQGEWKYVLVDACNPDTEPQDPHTGLYYDDRMVPQTTWEGLSTTMDIRSKQANKGFLSIEITAYMNTLSNVVFSIAKAIVALTVALIGFALSDVVKELGVQSILVGSNGQNGVFTRLFNSLYIPLVTIAFTFTGIYIFWTAIAKRQFRKSLTALLRSIGLYFAAFIIAAKPSFWMALPNNVAVMLEAVTISALDGSTVGKNSLCTSQVGSYQQGKKLTDGAGTADAGDIHNGVNGAYLKAITKNMQSVVSCTLWQEFLFKPWAQGQFGVDWNKTWAKGKVPSWAPAGHDVFDPNGKHVLQIAGDAAVPMGGGKFINNWALFQLSTETNVHSPIGKDGQVSKMTSGINNDWWRVVDVVSGYDEKDNITHMPSAQKDGKATDEKTKVPDETAKPLPAWGTWIGSASVSRLMVAVSAVFVAAVGVIGPLVFALMSAVYAIGIAIVMVFCPIMLLFAVWADRGYEMFKNWLNMLVNLIIKRVAYGMLMVLSILFSSTAINIMQQDNWWKGMITMIILTAILVKNRNKIVNALADIRMSSSSFNQTGQKVTNVLSKHTRKGAQMTQMGITGGVASVAKGGKLSTGVSAGVRGEMRNMSRQNNFARSILNVYNQQDVEKKGMLSDSWQEMSQCRICGRKLTNGSEVGALDDGGNICSECLADGAAEGHVTPTYFDFSKARDQQHEIDKDKTATVDGQNTRNTPGIDEKSKAKTAMDSNAAIRKLARAKTMQNLTTDQKIENVAEVASMLEKDLDNDTRSRLAGKGALIAKTPAEIAQFIDIVDLENAWQEKDFDYIRKTYAYAWTLWCQQNFGAEWIDALEKIEQHMANEQIRLVDILNEDRRNGTYG